MLSSLLRNSLLKLEEHLANEELTGRGLWEICQKVYQHDQEVDKELQTVKGELGGNNVVTSDLLSVCQEYRTLKEQIKKPEEDPETLMNDLRGFYERTNELFTRRLVNLFIVTKKRTI